MRIAIIGAGNVGGGLAAAATAAGREVTIAARRQENAAKVAGDVGATAAATVADASRGADVVVLAVPADAAKRVVADLLASLGFRPIDAGGLRIARSLEELALLNITLNARDGGAWQSGWRLAGLAA